LIKSVASEGVPIYILRNFGIENILLFRPTRNDQYIPGPLDVARTDKKIIISGNKSNPVKINANVKSKKRFIITDR
jgi:hypothetical protein